MNDVNVKLGDACTYLQVRGTIVATSGLDKTAIVKYIGGRYSGWVSWDKLQLIAQATEAVNVPA